MSDKPSREIINRARIPLQERSVIRMNKVLAATEEMLATVGPEKTSIPAIADASGVPRAAIYPFFPDKHALFSHLAQKHMRELAMAIANSRTSRALNWQTWVEAAIDTVANYYNAHPAASVLLLRNALTDADLEAHESKNVAIGNAFRTKAASFGVLPLLPTTPDVTTIAVEMAFACMRHGYIREGKVSPAICQEASRALVAYLGHWEQ